MTRIIILFLALNVVAFAGQSASSPDALCHPHLNPPSSAPGHLQAKPGVNFKGYKRSPTVKFDVDEAGTISNIRIKRSSGSVAADQFVLTEIRRWKYKPMPGCGTLETEALVTIDFSSP